MNTEVPIPKRLQPRPKFQGWVVPFTTMIDDVTGAPDFKATDPPRWLRCIREGLCALCGTRLDYWAWYIGGKNSTEWGVYFDAGMHEDCARYALQVCPFLALGKEYAAEAQPHAGFIMASIPGSEKWRNPKVSYLTKRRRDPIRLLDTPAIRVPQAVHVERFEVPRPCPVQSR